MAVRQEFYRLDPDMATSPRPIGTVPDGSLWRKKDIMQSSGARSQGGTYNNNKPGVAAAYATSTC